MPTWKCTPPLITTTKPHPTALIAPTGNVTVPDKAPRREKQRFQFFSFFLLCFFKKKKWDLFLICGKLQFDIEEECKDKRVTEEEEVEEEAGEENSEITMKTEMETSATNTCSKVEKLDYIHVRARRGQATDSHSLAERVR